jgi:hypothetical protein
MTDNEKQAAKSFIWQSLASMNSNCGFEICSVWQSSSFPTEWCHRQQLQTNNNRLFFCASMAGWGQRSGEGRDRLRAEVGWNHRWLRPNTNWGQRLGKVEAGWGQRSAKTKGWLRPTAGWGQKLRLVEAKDLLTPKAGWRQRLAGRGRLRAGVVEANS